MRRTLVNGGHKSQPTGPPLNWPRLTPGFSFRGALRPINPEHANKLDLDADSRFVLSTSMGEAREIVSLPEARERGLIRYFTGKPCKRGHVDWRLRR